MQEHEQKRNTNDLYEKVNLAHRIENIAKLKLYAIQRASSKSAWMHLDRTILICATALRTTSVKRGSREPIQAI